METEEKKGNADGKHPPALTRRLEVTQAPPSFSFPHVILDALLLLFGFTLAYVARFKSGLPIPLGEVPYGAYFKLWLFSVPIWWVIFAFHGLYYARLRESLASEFSRLPSAVSMATIATILTSYLVRGLPESRLTFIFQFVFSFLLIALGRRLARKRKRSEGRTCVIVGRSSISDILKSRLRRRYGKGLTFEEYSDDDIQVKLLHHRGDPSSLARELLKGKPVEIVVLGSPLREVTSALMLVALSGSAKVRFIPVGEALFFGTAHLSPEYGFPEVSPKSYSELLAIRRAKRVFDILFGVLLLILSSPLLLLSGFMVWLTSPGSVFYVQERIGVGGRKFKLLKFRTMYEQSELPASLATEFAEKYKLRDDPRVTSVGKWLRRFSLDELPQIINVIRGEMSLVGPRPIVPEEIEKYGIWSKVFLSFPPGLTGLWQVSGRSELTYGERIDLDTYYIMNWTPALDSSILLRTFTAILSRRGAY